MQALKKTMSGSAALLKSGAEPAADATARPQGKSRVERSEQIREALLQAAADVVGEKGYAHASITLITQKAGVGQGTFYNYFESRQAILDEIMPAVGRNMMAHIRKEVLAGKGHGFAELEEKAFRGFFSFLEIAPHFFRVLHEADQFAPAGYKQHIDNVFKQYMQFLQRSHDNGESPAYEPRELEVVALILMAARDYLAIHYVYGEGGRKELPEWVTQAYMKFVRYGLEGIPPDKATALPVRKKRKKKD
jgi:AcrR family transcriptional regulator